MLGKIESKDFTMKEWTDLEKDLTEWIKRISEINQLELRNSNKAIIGFPSDGFRSDGMLKINNTLIAIEVEAGQTHPDTNTGKYWLLYDQYKKYDKIILFHIYTPKFNSYNWRKKLGEFYIKKMKVNTPIDYILMDYRDSQIYDHVFTSVKENIKKRLINIISTLPTKDS